MAKIKSDIEIARAAKIEPIANVLTKFNIPDKPLSFSPMGRHIAKLNFEYINKLKEKKNNLFKQLDNLLIETFHTTSIIIDEQKLVNGEEGCLCNIDLEYIEQGAKQGLVDVSIMSDEDKNSISHEIKKILELM